MKKLIATFTTAALMGGAFAATVANPGVALIQKVSHGQLNVEKTIPMEGGMQAYVVSPEGRSQKMVIFTAENGKYLVAGNVVNSEGQNLTQQYTQKYVMAGVAKKAYKQVKSTAWFVQGDDKAPHKAYIVIDPNCIFCHLLYKELYPQIEAGKLQVRWVVAGFLKPSSAGKAAALLHATSDAQRVKMLHEDEMNFNQKKEEGGVKPLSADSKDPKVQAAFKLVKENTQFFERNQFQGTPTIIYADQDGTPAYYPGYAKGDQLQKLIDSMSGKW